MSVARERWRNVLVYFGVAEEHPSALLPGAEPDPPPKPLDAKDLVLSFALYGLAFGLINLAIDGDEVGALFKGVFFGIVMTAFSWWDHRRRLAAANRDGDPPSGSAAP